MRRSKDVLAVVGMLCIRPAWRAEFFLNPCAKAEELVGELDEDDLVKIEALAGLRSRPKGLSKDQYISRASSAFQSVCQALECPDPPCPSDPMPFTRARGDTAPRRS
jgi:hypothetical protein